MTWQFHFSIYPTQNQARNKNMNVYVNTTHISPWQHESDRSPSMRNWPKWPQRLSSEAITAFPLAPHCPQVPSVTAWSRRIPGEQGTPLGEEWMAEGLLASTALDMHCSPKTFPEIPSFPSPFCLHNHQTCVGFMAPNLLSSCSWGNLN